MKPLKMAAGIITIGLSMTTSVAFAQGGTSGQGYCPGCASGMMGGQGMMGGARQGTPSGVAPGAAGNIHWTCPAGYALTTMRDGSPLCVPATGSSGNYGPGSGQGAGSR